MSYFLNLSILKRNRNFRFLFIGQFVSFLGTMITSVALPYQIYSETHSTLMVGLLSLCQLLPLLVTALLGGALADRHHRRQLLLISECLMAFGCLMLTLNAWKTIPSVTYLFIIATVMSAINGLHRPALDSIVQQLVEKKDFPEVSALTTFKFSVCAIGGPALGGLLIAQYGLVITYFLDFLSFAISFIAILFITNMPKPVGKRDESTWSALKAGFNFARSRQELMGSYLVDIVAMVFGMPNALFPAIAHAHGGAKTLGLLYSAPAVGALIISFYSGWLKNISRYGVAISLAAGFWGVSIIFFGVFISTSLWIGLLFLALSGALDAISGMFRSMLWNESIPTEFRGRLSGIEMLSYLSGPRLGDTEAALVASAFGITFSIISGGILCVVGVTFCCYYLPKFWAYKSEVHAR